MSFTSVVRARFKLSEVSCRVLPCRRVVSTAINACMVIVHVRVASYPRSVAEFSRAGVSLVLLLMLAWL
jgi:hypothetical protein